MTPEVLADRIEQMSSQQLAAIDRALTPEAIQAMLTLMPELEPILAQFAEQQAPASTGPRQADPQAVQAFMQAVGAGSAGQM